MSEANYKYLAPSELILLNGVRFGQGRWKYKRWEFKGEIASNKGQKVNDLILGRAILIGSLLAAEQSGSIRLEFFKEKKILGLFGGADWLFVEPMGAMHHLPTRSFEAQFYLRTRPTLPKEIYEFVDRWVKLGRWSRWSQLTGAHKVIESVRAGLVDREALIRSEKKRFKIFTLTSYEVAAKTTERMDQNDIASLQQLFFECQATRPKIWARMVKGVDEALNFHTPQLDVD